MSGLQIVQENIGMSISKTTTKKAIMLSLVELLKQKNIDKISVTSICKNCGIQRQMFYYYFKDKYDAVNHSFYLSQLDILRSSLKQHTWGESIIIASNAILQNRDYYIHAFKSDDINSLFHYLFDFTLKVIRSIVLSQREDHALSEEQEYVLRQYVHGIVGILREWYASNMTQPVELLAHSIVSNIPEEFKDFFHDIRPEYLVSINEQIKKNAQ